MPARATTTPNTHILLVEDDPGLRQLLLIELAEAGYTVHEASSPECAITILAEQPMELVISDIRLPGIDGLELLKICHASDSPPAFIIITAFGTVWQAVQAIKQGADDFLTKPLDLEHFALAVRKALDIRNIRHELGRMRELLGQDDFHGLVGHSRPMLRLFEQMRLVAQSEGAVLITGESGSGKELVARGLHAESQRSERPLLAVNCAGIPEHLLESEFFGHKAGAFTGASATRLRTCCEAGSGG